MIAEGARPYADGLTSCVVVRSGAPFALARWKLAIVLERGFQRAGDDEKLLAFGPIIVETMSSAADLAETTGYGR